MNVLNYGSQTAVAIAIRNIIGRSGERAAAARTRNDLCAAASAAATATADRRVGPVEAEQFQS